ncbi:MAG: response regulator transcription factor, partial [Chloroflexota bacterium]
MSSTLPLITVIVVNDQLPVCKMWQQLIERTPGMTCPGYAKDGESAIELVREIEPDVVMMDVLMPGMRGDEAMQRIHEEFPEMIVIMYSADSSTERIAREAGAEEFLLMPVPPAHL